MEPEYTNQNQNQNLNKTLNQGISDSSNESSQTHKPSRWIGIISIALFVILGGLGNCPWYMWIVLFFLVVLTYGGTSKWGQLILGVILLIWGTPGPDDSYDVGGYQNYQTESTNKSVEQTESERKYIENKLWFLENQKARFDHAIEIGDMRESQRISDDAMSIKEELERKNLTPEQRRRLSRLFAI